MMLNEERKAAATDFSRVACRAPLDLSGAPRPRSFKGKRVFSDYSETVFLIRTGLLRPLPERKGRCYEFACKAALSRFGDYLIGVAWGEDEPDIYHAVAKSRGGKFYYDGILDACFDVWLYTRIFGWLTVHRMSLVEVRNFILKNGQYPSPSWLSLPPLDGEDERHVPTL